MPINNNKYIPKVSPENRGGDFFLKAYAHERNYVISGCI